MKQSVKEIKNIGIDKKDLIFASFLLLLVLASHWLTIAPTRFLVANAIQEIFLGKEWQLEENGVQFTLNKNGFYLGQKDKKQLLYDLKGYTSRFSNQQINSSTEQIQLLYDKIDWQRKGYCYLMKNGKKQKFYLIQASLINGGKYINLYLALDGKLSRIEWQMNQTDIGFWLRTEKMNFDER